MAPPALAEPYISGAEGQWIPQMGTPPPTLLKAGHPMQGPPQLSGYSLPTGPMLPLPMPEPGVQHVGLADAPPPSSIHHLHHQQQHQQHHQEPGPVPFQGGYSDYPAAGGGGGGGGGDPSLSSPPTEAQGPLRGLGLSSGPPMVPDYTSHPGGGSDLAEQNRMLTAPEPYANRPPQPSAQSDKGSKSGWFSGWFGSKVKNSQIETSNVAPPPAPLQEPTSSPPLFPQPSRPRQIPPPSTGVNPFSRRASQQQPVVHMAQNQVPMPQTLQGSADGAPM
ncbi:basic salivary proline-rich protein 4-like isoform X1 [Engraulis encrasicolus]|uniref:basic salivary proline-rich protein 4-like isoform X1 n=1 Tax=Engraulis encrasicolus TaxID=184585 RepID=UPI002FD147B2